MKDELIKILKMDNDVLKLYLQKQLIDHDYNPINADGFLYGQGDIPVMLIAHIDTVLEKPPVEIMYNDEQKLLFSYNGLGGDDRCGIYAILKMLEKHKPYVLFTEDEEKGLIGAYKTISSIEKPDVKFLINLDRKGINDCVFYGCVNSEFVKFIESFGYYKQYGSFSDISILSKAWDIAGVNLSVGYYNEHRIIEYIALDDLNDSLQKVNNILSYDYEKISQFEYRKKGEVQYIDYYDYCYAEDYDDYSPRILLLKQNGGNYEIR